MGVGQETRDRLRAEVRRLLLAGVSGNVFPGGVACVSFRDERGHDQLVATAAGTLSKGGRPVQLDTRYDLGRLTESFVSVAALGMAARRELDLDASLESVLTELRGGMLDGVTIGALLWHRANLAPARGLYLDVPHEHGSPAARRWLINEAARRSAQLGKGSERSDLGYLLIGEAIARAAGAPLDEVVRREVLAPLGIEDEVLYPGPLPPEVRLVLRASTAPTERCQWRGRHVRGEVHDENAAALGGVAGHAGLFGTAQAVALFGRAILDALMKRRSALPSRPLQQLFRADEGPLRPGWELKHGDRPACGRRMGARSFGQLGLTGTSIWCDPDLDVVVVLLTNRVCPSRANVKIDGFRPAFHDGVLAALGLG